MQAIEWYCADGHVIDSYPDDGRDRFDSDGKPLQYRLPPVPRCIGPWDPDLGVWLHLCDRALAYRRANGSGTRGP